MTENMQVSGRQRREQLIVRCCLSFAVADDVKSDTQRLISALDEAADGVCEIEYKCFENGELLLSDGGKYDAVFLDICMGSSNGIETAEKLRLEYPDIPIVFVTSSDEYVWTSFSVHPFDYLLKPFSVERVRKLLNDLLKIINRSEQELTIKTARRELSIPFSKISYAAAQNHVVNIAADGSLYRSTVTFSYVKECLCTDPRFLLCNRGVIVNMDKVLRFDSDIIEMPDGASFPVRQKDRAKLFGEFTQYQFRHIRNEV